MLTDTDPVLAAYPWPTNADLIADVARLYLDPHTLTLDATYGRGRWWTRWRPTPLIAADNKPRPDLDLVADFRHLPFPDATFPQIAYDPPYVSVGGRATTGIADHHDRYGLTDAPTSPAGVQALIDAGLADIARVATPGATVITKCQDYISSGRLWPGTHLTLTAALAVGLHLVDRFEHVGSARAQPDRTRRCTLCRGRGDQLTGRICHPCNGTGRIPSPQVHARRNLSTLFVLRRPA